MTLPLRAILTDIEGTTTPIAFVHEVLFPYARARLATYLEAHANDPLLDEIPRPRLESLIDWMDRDEKIGALKEIQGHIWEAGYANGDIQGNAYPDVAPSLRKWAKAGLKLYVYSSGSIAAQKRLFGHTEAGDLTPLFQGFFDTGVGPKREAASYVMICRGANLTPVECLFLSDVEAELDAAARAGLRTCQLVRLADKTKPGTRHEIAADFREVAGKFKLPHG